MVRERFGTSVDDKDTYSPNNYKLKWKIGFIKSVKIGLVA